MSSVHSFQRSDDSCADGQEYTISLPDSGAFPVLRYPDQRSDEEMAQSRVAKGLPAENSGVLVIYTGGTIGSAPMDALELRSPEVVKPWPQLVEAIPALHGRGSRALDFRVDAVAFAQPLDSCNVGPREWQAMAKIVAENLEDYEGFVIAHGTDTLAYTASALSFMLRDLDRPVILTASQLSGIWHARNDAEQNLVTALSIANPRYSRIPIVPEVCVFCGSLLLRGNRCRKMDADGFGPYDSPNFPPLGRAGAEIEINEQLIRKSDGARRFHVDYSLASNVFVLHVFPGMQGTELFRRAVLPQPAAAGESTRAPQLPRPAEAPVRAVVLGCYGTGNVPTDPAFLDQLRDATSQGVIIMDVTQCIRGKVELGRYETSLQLLEAGLIGGFDITPEAAVTKLMSLLGSENLDAEGARRMATQSLAGEQSVSQIRVGFPASSDLLTVTPAHPRCRTAAAMVPAWSGTLKDAAIVFSRATIADAPAGLRIAVYLNVDSRVDLGESHLYVAGRAEREECVERTVILPLNPGAQADLRQNMQNSVTVALESESGSFSWHRAELDLFVEQR